MNAKHGFNSIYPTYSPMASNNSTAYEHAPLSRQDIVFAVFYSIIVLIGVPANCIIITIVRKTPSMHTTTNCLLMNLAIAGLTTLTFCPGMYDFSLNKLSIHCIKRTYGPLMTTSKLITRKGNGKIISKT